MGVSFFLENMDTNTTPLPKNIKNLLDTYLTVRAKMPTGKAKAKFDKELIAIGTLAGVALLITQGLTLFTQLTIESNMETSNEATEAKPILTVADILSMEFIQTFLSVEGQTVEFGRDSSRSNEPCHRLNECVTVRLSFRFLYGIQMYWLIDLMGNRGYRLCWINSPYESVSMLFAHASYKDVFNTPSLTNETEWANLAPYVG